MFERISNCTISATFLTVLLCRFKAQGSQSVCFMQESNFFEVCRKITQLPAYLNRHHLTPNNQDRDCDFFKVYLPTDENTTQPRRVSARGCPSTPQLFLSDANTIYSALVFGPIGRGLQQLYEISNLRSLGYEEKNFDEALEFSHAQSVVTMEDYKFRRLCTEILNAKPLRRYYTMNTNGEITETKQYDVFQFDTVGMPIVDTLKARGPCPTDPPLFLSDGPQNFSAFLYRHTDGQEGLQRFDMAKNLVNLGYDKERENRHRQSTLLRDHYLDSIILMQEVKFELLCKEIVQLPALRNLFSLSTSHPPSEVTSYNVYLPPMYEVYARKCPIEPKLFVSDGETKHSLFVYRSTSTMELIQIDELDRTNDLRYDDSIIDSSVVLRLPETTFRALCNEVISMFYFRSIFTMEPESMVSKISENNDVYLFGNDVIFGRGVTTRVCPTKPELHLSDGMEDYSVYIYTHSSSHNGLIRQREASKLNSLGYRESDEMQICQPQCQEQ